MSNIDIVARLQLRAEQFSSETGARFAEMKTRARSAAQEVRSTFAGSFADVQKLAARSLTMPRTTTGSLDLSGEIASLQRAAASSDQTAIAMRELSIAQTAAAASGRDGAQALKLEADAAAVASLAAEKDAASTRQRILALEAVQVELNRATSATAAYTAENERATAAASRQMEIYREQAAAARVEARGNRFQGLIGATDTAGLSGKSARVSADVFVEQERLVQIATRLRNELDPLAAVQSRVNAELVEARAAFAAAGAGADELARAEAAIVARGNTATEALKQQAGVTGMARAGMQQLSFQLNDVAVQYAAGTSASIIFAQQSGQVIQALQMMTTKTSGFLGFLGGPWGLALGTAMVVLTPFVAKLFQGGDALKDLLDKKRKDADQSALQARANEIWANSFDGVIAKTRELTGELELQLKTRQQMEAGKLDEARSTVVDNQRNFDRTLQQLITARAKLANAIAVRDTPADARLAPAYAAAADRAQARVVELERKIGIANDSLKAAQAGARSAEIPIIERRVEASLDGATAATERYTAALGALRLERDRDAITAAAFETRLRVLQQTRDRDIKAARDAQRETRSGPLTDFISPIEGRVGSGFGRRTRPTAGASSDHKGIDIAAAYGTPVKAAAGGVVVHVGKLGALGNAVLIDHGGGTISQYGHLSSLTVAKGQRVAQGDQVGGVGSTGVSTGNHLHYGVKVGGRFVDPRGGRFRTDETAVDLKASKAVETAARQAEELKGKLDAAADAVSGMNARWDEQPRLIDRAAADTDRLNEIIAEYAGKSDEASKAIVANARAGLAEIQDGLARPYRDYVDQQRQSVAIQGLILQGRDTEAAALQTAIRFQEQEVVLNDEQLRQLVAMERQQQAIADAIEDQRRQVGLYTGAVGSLQNEFDQFLKRLDDGKPLKAVKGILSGFGETFRQLKRDIVSEQIFGGLDREIEQYVRKLTGRQTPAEILAEQTRDAGKVLATRTTDAGIAVEDFAAVVRRVTGELGGSGSAAAAIAPKNLLSDELLRELRDGSALEAANDNDAGTAEIIVTGKRFADAVDRHGEQLLSASDFMALVTGKMVDRLEALLGVKLPAKLAVALNGAAQGYGAGASIGGTIFGKKGGQIGGAAGAGIGAIIGPQAMAAAGPYLAAYQLGQSIMQPIGQKLGFNKTAVAIGGLPGGALAKLFGLGAKVKTGGSTIGGDEFGNLSIGSTFGNSNSAKAGSKSGANAVISGIQSIADAIGARITGSPGITYGVRDGEFRVNTAGTSLKKKKGAVDFGKDGEEDAIAFAVAESLKRGVITGISQASVNIVKSGQDLQAAIQKVVLIESIPRELKGMLDPVGAAVDELNRKFQKTVDALREGGASAEQMAQAQRLYDLQLAEVKISTESASQSLKDYLLDLRGGPNSPYSLRDQEKVASEQLKPFLDQIAAGQSIDQGKYQEAASRALDVDRQLYGSTSKFFEKQDLIQAATSKAIATIDNAAPITAAVESPFARATADAAARTAAGIQTSNELAEDHNALLRMIADRLRNLSSNGGLIGANFIGSERLFAA